MPSASLAANLLSECVNASSDYSFLCANENDSISFPCYQRSSNGVATIQYKVDQGNVAVTIENEEFRSVLEEVFSLWENAASIDFVYEGNTELNIDVNNFDEYLERVEEQNYSPIIIDDYGAIIEDLFGVRSVLNVLGFAIALRFDDDNYPQYIKQSVMVLNDLLMFTILNDKTDEDPINTIKLTILHEAGHAIGIAHSQGGFWYENEIEEENIDKLPIMYPVLNPESELKLKTDDIIAANICYSKTTSSSDTGTLTGTVTIKGGETRGVNLSLYKVSQPYEEVISTIIDPTGQGWTRGNFIINNIPIGDYVIRAQKQGITLGMTVEGKSPYFVEAFYMGDDQAPLRESNFVDGFNQAKIITINRTASTDISFELRPEYIENNPKASFTISGALSNGITLYAAPNKSKKYQLILQKPNNEILDSFISTSFRYGGKVIRPAFNLQLDADTDIFKINIVIPPIAWWQRNKTKINSATGAFVPLKIIDSLSGYSLPLNFYVKPKPKPTPPEYP